VPQTSPTDRVVISVDPHKASWTAAAVDTALQPREVIRVAVSAEGYRRLRRFAQRWNNPSTAIEGAAGLGAPLTQRLHADGIEVIDVPAKLAARVRVLSTVSVRVRLPRAAVVGSFASGVWLVSSVSPLGWRACVLSASGVKDRPA